MQTRSPDQIGDKLDVECAVVESLPSSELGLSVDKCETLDLYHMQDEGLFRALPLCTLLHHLPNIIRSKSSSDVDYFQFAEQVSHKCIDDFLSHTWRSKVLMKLWTLFYIYNCEFAIKVTVTTGVICLMGMLLLQHCLAIPIPFTYWVIPGFSEIPERDGAKVTGGVTGIILLVACTVGWCAFFFGHYPRVCAHRRHHVFLDKACIHQTDHELRKNGIRSLGVFLQRCRRLVILWDQSYFERLWCVFEVASFLKAHGRINQKSLNASPVVMAFAPVQLGLFTVGMSVIVCLGMLSLIAFFYINNLYEFIAMDERPVFYLVMYLACTSGFWLPKAYFIHISVAARRAMHKQIAEFSVRKAKCSYEADRELLYATICEWFGSLDNFDQVVRSDLPIAVEQSLGSDLALVPYRSLLFEVLGSALISLELLFKTADAIYAVRWVSMGFAIWLIWNPLWVISATLIEHKIVDLQCSICARLFLQLPSVSVLGLWVPLMIDIHAHAPLWFLPVYMLILGGIVYCVYSGRLKRKVG